VSVLDVVPYVLSGAVVVGIAGYNLSAAARQARVEARATRKAVRTRRRVRAGAEALRDAAQMDAAFSPEVAIGTVRDFVALADSIWRGGKTHADDRPGAELVREWARTLALREGGIARIIGEPRIGVLDVVSRRVASEDRVAVRVTMRLALRRRTWVDQRTLHYDARWTLARAANGWEPVEIEPYAGDPSIERRPFIARPADDTERLHEESVGELAAADAAISGSPAELLTPGTAPYQALLELSVLDGRYAPLVLEASLKYLLDAWQTATAGPDTPLQVAADDDAVDELLFAGDGSARLRVVARDLRLQHWWIAEFDHDASPPSVLVQLAVDGVYYRIDAGNTPHPGDTLDPHQMQLWWRLALADHAPTQWRLHNANAAQTA
jgi:hypothetical protein